MKLGTILFEYLKKNKYDCICIVIVLILGIVAGIFTINNSSSEKICEISNNIKSINKLSGQNVDNWQLFKNSLKQNILIVFWIWFIGCTIIGFPFIYIIVLYKGFCIGYTISAIMAIMNFRKAIIFVILSLLPQNILIIPSLLLISISGIKLYRHIVKVRENCNIKLELIRHTIISSISLISIVVASLIEVYISTNLLLSYISTANI